MRGLGQYRAGAVALVVAALSLFLASPALAWEISKNTNGVIVQRESSDTSASVYVTLFYDYKAGDTSWVFSTAFDRIPNSYGAYNKSRDIARIDSLNCAALEVPLEPAYRLQMVRVSLGVSPFTVLQTFAVINDPQEVAIEGTPTVLIGSPVSLDSSVSVEGTLPVTVAGIGSSDSWALDVAFVGALLCLGFAIGRGVLDGPRS